MSNDRSSRSVLDPFTGIVTARHTGIAIDFPMNLSYRATINLPEGTTEDVYIGRPHAQPWRNDLKVYAFAVGTPIFGIRQGESLLWGALSAELPWAGPCQGGMP